VYQAAWYCRYYNKDNLCLPWALVVAIGYVNKNKDQTKVRRDIGKLQTLRANELLQAASVTNPKEGCGIPELQQFQQQHLKDYCIVVYQYQRPRRYIQGRSKRPKIKFDLSRGPL
jgi:hypothetical protein